MRVDTQVGLLTERRQQGPYGLAGGGVGRAGRNRLLVGRTMRSLPAKGSLIARAGEVIRIETPGGGGFGRPTRVSAKKKPEPSRAGRGGRS
jgi:N-methylhydantoinase B